MQSEVASRFSDFGTSAEDDRERDAELELGSNIELPVSIAHGSMTFT